MDMHADIDCMQSALSNSVCDAEKPPGNYLTHVRPNNRRIPTGPTPVDHVRTKESGQRYALNSPTK